MWLFEEGEERNNTCNTLEFLRKPLFTIKNKQNRDKQIYQFRVLWMFSSLFKWL